MFGQRSNICVMSGLPDETFNLSIEEEEVGVDEQEEVGVDEEEVGVYPWKKLTSLTLGKEQIHGKSQTPLMETIHCLNIGASENNC